MIAVSRMVRVPSDSRETRGRRLKAKLATKHTGISPAMILFFRAGGTMTARNMPNRATLRALTARAGISSPATQPRAVPSAQQGDATSTAP
jgi:hypothetical protein